MKLMSTNEQVTRWMDMGFCELTASAHLVVQLLSPTMNHDRALALTLAEDATMEGESMTLRLEKGFRRRRASCARSMFS